MSACATFICPAAAPSMPPTAWPRRRMPAATLTALDVLRAGGNALDAAIAAVAVLAVIEPQSTGIGGDCFCLYAPAGSGRVIALNGSGRAPAAASTTGSRPRGIAATREHLAARRHRPRARSRRGRRCCARMARKGLDELLQPAIRFADEGFPVHAAGRRRLGAQRADKLRAAGADAFLPGGAAPQAGDRFVQPALAETLRAIARARRARLLRGRRSPPTWWRRCAPAAACTPRRISPPACTARTSSSRSASRWRGYDVWQCPPNGQGLLVLMLLGILGGLETAPDGPLGAIRLHRHLEAARLVYRDRDAFLADPAQADVPVARLTRSGIPRRAARPDPRRRGDAGDAARRRGVAAAHRDTIYLCVVDRDGNACSFINSLFQGFGCGILAERSGVMLQNRGFGFRAASAAHPNCIAPSKRPMHTIIPGMADQGRRGGDAVRRHGRAFPADGPDAVPDQPDRLRAGHPGGARPAAGLPIGGSWSWSAASRRRSRDALARLGPRGRAHRRAAWRRPGDPDRPRARRA